MQVMLAILALMLFFEAAVLIASPEFVRAVLAKVSAADLRLMGVVELMLALPALIIALLGWGSG